MNKHDHSRPDGREDGPAGTPGDASPDVNWTSLSGFQRDLLVSITHLERQDGPPSGIAVKSDLADRYESSINHGRLYQNLDELVDLGLVEKSFYDGRTNAYRLTGAGRGLLESAAERLADI